MVICNHVLDDLHPINKRSWSITIKKKKAEMRMVCRWNKTLNEQVIHIQNNQNNQNDDGWMDDDDENLQLISTNKNDQIHHHKN